MKHRQREQSMQKKFTESFTRSNKEPDTNRERGGKDNTKKKKNPESPTHYTTLHAKCSCNEVKETPPPAPMLTRKDSSKTEHTPHEFL